MSISPLLYADESKIGESDTVFIDIDLYFNNTDYDWSSQYFTAIKQEEKENPNILYQSTEIIPSLSLDDYVGIYTSPMYGEISITQNHSQLDLSFKANNGNFEFNTTLHHWNENTFSMEPGNPIEASTLVIFVEKNGKVKELNWRYLDRDHTGIFTKNMDE
jgi:hypothetical protein